MNNEKSNILDQWMVIVNPNAGRHKIDKDWDIINDLLIKAKIDFQNAFTEFKEHAIKLSYESIEKGFRKFIVVGGDGTLNEVVNGIFTQNKIPSSDFLVAMIPVGTGNDWCRMFNVPFKYNEAIRIIEREKQPFRI